MNRAQRANHAGSVPDANPYVGLIGWCHSCESLQWGDDARWQEMWWMPGESDWACINCDGEPWGMGVWVRSARPVDRDSSLGRMVTAGGSIYDLDAEQLDQMERARRTRGRDLGLA